MKKLILFALLASVPAFGQAYSSTALQNSPGNYSRAVPYAQITICASTDTAVPCTVKAITYVDDTLTTQCTQKSASGVLTGNPAWGANCNNPGLADPYGNFTVFVAAGNYRLCVYAQTWTCQEISIGGGGGGGGTGVSCSVAVSGSLARFLNTTTLSCDQFSITDGLGHISSQSYTALGAVNGMVGMVGGLPSPGTVGTYKLATHEFRWLGATLVTPYYMSPPTTLGAIGQLPSLNAQTVDGNGDVVNSLSWINNSTTVNGTPCTLGSTCTVTTTQVHALSFTIYNSGGLASGSTAASTDYVTVPFGCTLQAYNLVVDSGTITVKFWKIATGTAIPTVSNSISTSGVGIASGTAIHSTTLSDFTTTTITANDILAMNITAASGPTYVNGVLQCQ